MEAGAVVNLDSGDGIADVRAACDISRSSPRRV